MRLPIQWTSQTFKLFFLAILTTLIITACGGGISQNTVSQQSSSSKCQVIQHEMGETEICDQPQKVVVLGPYILEPLLALDVQPSGFADHIPFHQGDYNNPSQQIPYLGQLVNNQPINVGLAYNPSMEALLRIKPDLILGSETNKKQYKNLSQIAPTVLLKWADAKPNLLKIAKIFDRSQKAEQVLTAMEQRLATAKKAFAPIVAAHPQVLLLSSGGQSLPEQLRSFQPDRLCPALVANLGFKVLPPPDLAQSAEGVPPLVSIEILPQFQDADSIILLGANFTEFNQVNAQMNFDPQIQNLQQKWQENAIAKSMQASKEGRVYFIPGYLCAALPGTIGTELYLNELEKQLLPVQ
ncbi:iron-siderophore ABC transporter substrate-binding protein [Nodularia sp. LEGE 06071]|nr:iron-siderophore ABC transporter substrate-binding protein [Nodularia sp. LEGE 06071]MCC2691266.1 iron-siderophore ABC transporter substrate-binding protein [Nodularia sp. LEGE 04288]